MKADFGNPLTRPGGDYTLKLEQIEGDDQHVNWTLSELWAGSGFDPRAAKPDNLRSAIMRASPNLPKAIAITQALIETESVTAAHDQNSHAAIVKLRSSRVLVAVRPYVSCYRVTPRFRDALEGLRDGL